MYKEVFVEHDGEAKRYKQTQTEDAFSDVSRATSK